MNKTKNNRLLASTMTLSLLVLPAAAIDYNWNVAGPADWSDAANWDQAAVPTGGSGNHARINNGGIVNMTADINDIQDIFVGVGSGASGTLNQSAGNTFQGTGSWMFVGQAGGTGTYNLSGGTQGKERLYIGRADGGTDSNGTLNLSGSGLVDNSETNIGVDGNGTTGSAVITGNGRIQTGLFQISNGSTTITDTGSIAATGEFWVGSGGGNTGTLSMDSGSISSDSWIVAGRGDATGTITLSGDSVMNKAGNAEHFIVLGTGNGNGTLNIQGNAVVNSNSNIVIGEHAGSTGTVNQSGGTVNVVDNTIHATFTASIEVDGGGSGNGVYNLSGGTLNAETIDVDGGTFNMTGGILSTTVFNGDLTQEGGTLSPGASPGSTLIGGDYDLQAGADILIELAGLTAGTEHDQVAVTGTTNLAGSITVSLGSYNPEIGDTYTVIDNQGADPVIGTFAEGSSITVSGREFAVSYVGGDGNDVVLTVTSIPEPSTSLLGLGALFVFAIRRRRA